MRINIAKSVQQRQSYIYLIKTIFQSFKTTIYIIDLSRNDITTFSISFPISLVQNGVKVGIFHEKIDKYRKYQISSTFGEVVTDC